MLICKPVNTSEADVQSLRSDTLMAGPFSRVSFQCIFCTWSSLLTSSWRNFSRSVSRELLNILRELLFLQILYTRAIYIFIIEIVNKYMKRMSGIISVFIANKHAKYAKNEIIPSLWSPQKFDCARRALQLIFGSRYSISFYWMLASVVFGTSVIFEHVSSGYL